MRFSIIVPVYNVEQFLPECLDSILAQSFTDWECICVDDGSPDKCGAILDSYAEKDTRFRIIHKENGGVSSARNVALDIARGEFVVFVDSDDAITKNALKYLAELIDQYGPDLVKFSEGVEESIVDVRLREYDLNNPSVARAAFNNICGSLIAWNGCYKRETIRELRFVEGMPNGEDILFGSGFFCRCNKVVVTGAKIYKYRHREGSAVNTISLRHLVSVCKMIEAKCTGDVWKWSSSHGVDERFFSKIRTHMVGEVLSRIAKLPRYDREAAWDAFFSVARLVPCSWVFRTIGRFENRALAKLILLTEFNICTFVSKLRS